MRQVMAKERGTAVAEPAARPRAVRANAATASGRMSLLLAGLVLVSSLLLDAILLPGDHALGRDFAAFYAAAVAWLHGLNPYDWAQLGHVEAHLRAVGNPHAAMTFNSFANPPLFAWAMSPFTALPARPAYGLWLVLMVVALLAGLLLAGRAHGLRRSHWLLLFAVSPVSIIALFLGQQTPLLLLVLAAALAALQRGRYELAGACLCLGWLKPHLFVPIVVALVALLAWREARCLLAAFLGGSALLGLASLLLTGPGLTVAWLQGLIHYGRTLDQVQPDLSSLAGLYLSVLGRPWSVVVAAGLVAAWALGLIALALWTRRLGLAPSDPDWTALACAAIVAWLLVLPYTHPQDLVLVAVALPALFRGVTRPGTEGSMPLRRRGVLHTPSSPPRRMQYAPTDCRDGTWAPAIPGDSLLKETSTGLLSPWTRLALSMLLLAPEVDLLGFRPNFVLSYSMLVPLTLLLALRPWRLLRLRERLAVGAL